MLPGRRGGLSVLMGDSFIKGQGGETSVWGELDIEVGERLPASFGEELPNPFSRLIGRRKTPSGGGGKSCRNS